MRLRLFIIFSFFTFAVNAQDSVNAVETDIIYGFEEVDVKPEYPGGDIAFMNFINKNFMTSNVERHSSHRIIVFMIIEKDGSVKDVKIAENPGYGLGDEAMRVMKLIDKKWKPGMKEGKPVRVKKIFPIKINVS